MAIKFIKNRNNDVIEFKPKKIKDAILKAYWAVSQIDKQDLEKVLEWVFTCIDEVWKKKDGLITVEQVQDCVEKTLIKFNKYEVAKAYIIYREKQSEERKEKHEHDLENLEAHRLSVTKHDWTKEPFDSKKVKAVYDIISWELEADCSFEEISETLKSYVIDWIKTKDITKLIVKAAIDLISVENTKWQFIAWRFAVLNLYKKSSRNRWTKLNNIYSSENYKALFDSYIAKWLYYKDFYKYYSDEDILEAWKNIVKERDLEYNYTTILMLNKRYLLNPNKHVMELPQEMYMSVALFLAIPEKDENRMEVAMKIYEYCSSQKISLPTPTLMNARTNYQQLSSCFKLNLEDDLRSIYHNIENMAQISKFWWGIWAYLWHIRSRGWSVRWIDWASWWVMPWVKVVNDTAIAVNQLGSRNWAISITLDMWHRDIYEFLDMQTETWDIRRKAFDLFPAVSIPDLFMKRVEENGKWTLFDPKEVYDKKWFRIENCFNEEFEEKFIALEGDPEMTLKKVVDAKDLFKHFMKTVVETWMPYVFFRDIVNKANPNKHAWNIYSTQLCTEICQNTSPAEFISETEENWDISIKYKAWDTVVCNLASINCAKVFEEKEMEAVIPIAMRILDNVITLNFYPIKEAEMTAKKYRSVWLWFMWLAEHLACSHIRYDSPEAVKYTDELFEKYAYHTLKASNDISKERWAYDLFEWSEWSKWILLWKDEEYFKKNSKMSDKWVELIKNVKKDWMRFAYHLSPAPNTSTALVVWTTAWVLPVYKKYFVETNSIAPSVNVAPNLNKENFWFYKEYVNMNMNDVIDTVWSIYKWIDQSASFEWMINPMNVSPAEIYWYYFKAWKSWIKTVYYVRSMSMEVESCVSCSG